MNLIHFHGLNCYHDSMITLAGNFGLNYEYAFSHLWSESDFRYDPICSVFLTRKLPEMLEKMGMKLKQPCVSQKEKDSEWSNTINGKFVIIGMDAFLIPWNPLYQIQHGPHYFITKKTLSDQQLCFDPTYGFHNKKYPSKSLVSNSYALIPVKMKTSEKYPPGYKSAPFDQAKEVIKNHPKTLNNFRMQADIWVSENEETALLPAKFTDALLTGRYLYRHFLEKKYINSHALSLFQDKEYYRKWIAVKNGFYKAALDQRNNIAYSEAFSILESLLKQEMTLAEQILCK